MNKRNIEEGYFLTEARKLLQPEGSETPDDCEFSVAVCATTSLASAMHPVVAVDDGSNVADEMAQLRATRGAAGILATASSLDSVYIPNVKYTQTPGTSEYFAVTAMAHTTGSLTTIVFVRSLAGTTASRAP